MILRALVIVLLFLTASGRSTRAAPSNDAVSNEAASSAAARAVGLEILHDGLVLVPVVVNGAGPHLFLLDTGGASTIVSDTLARRLGLPSTGSHRIDTASGSRTAGIGRVDELRLGGETFTSVDVLWMDLANVQAGDSRIQGVVGQDLLRTRSFLLDYEARRLTFDPAGGGDGRRLPLDWSDGRPLVHAVAHHTGGHAERQTSAALRFVIDTGASHVILFDRLPARKTPAPGPAQSFVDALRRRASATMTMATHAGSQPVMTATVDRLELTQETALRDVTAALVPMDSEQGRIEDGLLPASLFRAIYFDNRANEVVLTSGR